MTRYHVATPGECEAVRAAINSTIPRAGHRVVNGVAIPVDLAAEEARLGLEPEQLVHTSRLVLGADGTAALELPETTHVEAALGRTIRGTPTPRDSDCVKCTRAREYALLPTGVRDKLDDKYVDSVLTSETEDTPQKRAEIADELQGRAAAALARKTTRVGAKEIERALGLGRRSP
jgi:hypothetical protein